MARRESIIYQVIKRLKELIRFGQSKHLAKQEEKFRCQEEGRPWNPARVEGIYSFKTYEVYKEHCLDFANWVRKEKGVKSLEQARQYVKEYLEKEIAEGKSPWTLRVKASALAKLFGCSTPDFGVELPSRSRGFIHRSRLEREHDKHFSERRNRDVVEFCRATGLRRKELLRVTWRDVYRGEDGRLMVHVDQGKGGRSREVPVAKGMEEVVWEARERARLSGQEKLFPHVVNRMDVHSYRREYAMARYRELQQMSERELEQEIMRENLRKDEMEALLKLKGKTYNRQDGRAFEKFLLAIVSKNLGHNRIEVVARHYLD